MITFRQTGQEALLSRKLEYYHTVKAEPNQETATIFPLTITPERRRESAWGQRSPSKTDA